MAIKIGITGGIGSGKSVVSRLLEVLGVPVYISDTEAKRITQTDELIRHELTKLVGEEVYQGSVLNRPLLASYLFGDPAHAKAVNAIIHPRVKDDFRRWVARFDDKALVAMESAILIEAGFSAEVDVLAVVSAPQEVRVLRAVRRDATTSELVMKRIEAQMSDEERLSKADFVIQNNGKEALIPQVLELISFASKNNAYLCSAKKELITKK